MNHLKEVHGKRVPTILRNGFSGNLKITNTATCLSCDNQDFIAMMTKVQTGLWHLRIFGVGTQEDLANFGYSIELTSHDGSSKLNSQEPVISLTKASKDILRDGEGLIMADQFMTSLRKSGPIKFKITIDKK